MNEKIKPLFGGGETYPEKKVVPFGKKGVEVKKVKAESKYSTADEKIFAQFLDDDNSSGDDELDELRGEYIALQAFRQVDDVGLSDSMREDMVKEQIMEKLNEKKAA